MARFQPMEVCSEEAGRKGWVTKEVCPVCGGTYYADVGIWGYRIAGKDGRTRCVCSYRCMRRVEKERAAKAAEKEKQSLERKAAREAAETQRKREATKQRLEEIAMKIDWKRPDRDKETGEKLTVYKIASFLVQGGICKDQSSAEKYIRKKVPAESYYQEKIMEALRKRAEAEGLKHKVWKASQGPYSQGGVSDVLAVIGGVMMAVEVKRPMFGAVSANQKKFIDDVIEAGGIGGVAVYPEDLDEIWGKAAEIRGVKNDERVQVRGSEV